jgi:rubrerythrin/DNA-directed RNA polymerase subunit RPC12/RpoP
MGREKGSDYVCQACGAEADLILEGFDTVQDVMKVGTMACEHCGSRDDIVLSDQDDETLKAVSVAVQREKDAYLFYTKAAKKTSSERGRDMFTQLAGFELNHYKKMIHLYHSLQKAGAWVPYAGQKALKPSRSIEEARGQKDTHKNDVDALTIAIKKEEEAQALYKDMADRAQDPTGKEMMKKLAGEEEVHRRILNDQLYALSNRGLWVWAE